MYRKKDRHTGDLFQDIFPFGGGLDPDNRWMKMSGIVPWDELEYVSKPENFSEHIEGICRKTFLPKTQRSFFQ